MSRITRHHRLPRTRTTLRASLLALLASAPIAAATSTPLVVDDDGGPGVAFTELQDAIDAAVNGQTILVRSGRYLPFVIDGKGLVLVADTGASVEFFAFNAVSTVRNVPADQRLIISGIGPAPGILLAAALRLEDNAGPVWLQDCQFRGRSGTPDVAALMATDCASVIVNGCTLTGSFGNAEEGVRLEASNVSLFDTVIIGGQGTNGPAGPIDGMPGGPGLVVLSGDAFLSGCDVTGGKGGKGGPFEVVIPCGDGGAGGTALTLGAGAPRVTLRDTTLTAGAGGGADAFCSPGPPGLASMVVSGALVPLPESARSLDMQSPVRVGESITADFSGQPGDVVWAIVSASPSQSLPFGNLGGTFLLSPPFNIYLFGGVDGAGQISFTSGPLAPFPPAAAPLTVFVQGVFDVPGVGLLVSGGRSLTAID